MAFTAKDVAALREQTGAGMMDCKKALTEADGDMKKATEILRERGVAVAAKKAGRIASEGAVAAFVSANGKVGALAEINCESDFVAKGEEFLALCVKAAKHAAEVNPASVEEMLGQKVEGKETVLELVNAATAKIGEKISFRRFCRMEVACGKIESYIHLGGKIGVLVEMKTNKDLNSNESFRTLCHDVAMHIAAFAPKYVSSADVPADEVEHEKEILRAQALNEGKPAQIVEKMIGGRIKKFYEEICLMDQAFVKDQGKTVTQAIKEVATALGAEIVPVRFERFVMGEGLEKKNENFAEEIAKIQNA